MKQEEADKRLSRVIEHLEEKVVFKDLSWPLKAAVVGIWVIGVCWILVFLLSIISYA